jgi:hypothetical protein
MDISNKAMANKALVLTVPARGNFGIIARRKRFGGGVGAFLPQRARKRRHNAGVRSIFAIHYHAYSKKLKRILAKNCAV